MRLYRVRTALFIGPALLGALCIAAPGQDAQSAPAPPESRGLPPRASPAEYPVQAKAGNVTIGAEFMEHAVPTPDGAYSSEEYVVVEVGMYGPPQSRVTLNASDFSLRINGKKTPSPSQPYTLVFKSLKNPEWEPPKAQKPKTSLGGGGGGDDTDGPPVPPKMPLEMRRTMEQRVQRASMLEGDRALPQAGLLFFEYRGKAKSIRSLELIYSGSAGTATLALQP